MDQQGITDRISARFGARILAVSETRGQQSVTVAPGTLLELMAFLRDEPELDFDALRDLAGVDYLGYPAVPSGVEREWRFEVVYQLYSFDRKHRYRVKVAVEDDSVEVPTLFHMWKTANWCEREVFDQYGVRFAGHGNLRRILNHDEFEGHPLRKDYPIQKRQKLSRPADNLFPDDPEWA